MEVHTLGSTNDTPISLCAPCPSSTTRATTQQADRGCAVHQGSMLPHGARDAPGCPNRYAPLPLHSSQPAHTQPKLPNLAKPKLPNLAKPSSSTRLHSSQSLLRSLHGAPASAPAPSCKNASQVIRMIGLTPRHAYYYYCAVPSRRICCDGAPLRLVPTSIASG